MLEAGPLAEGAEAVHTNTYTHTLSEKRPLEITVFA